MIILSKNNGFTAGEIRNMLDMSRSAMRYYIRKGLLDVDKNDENGYQSFSHNNLSDLRDIAYLRQMLDFGINDIQDCFNASTLDDYESIFRQKRAGLEAEIEQKQTQLNRLKRWEDYLADLKRSPDSIQIVEFSPFVFSPTFSPVPDKLSLLCASFLLKNGIPKFNGYGYCFDEPEEEELKNCKDITYRFPKGKYIYAMFNCEYSIEDPGLLDSVLRWVEERGYSIKSPIQVDYFFRIKNESEYRFFYAVTIPFSNCNIIATK